MTAYTLADAAALSAALRPRPAEARAETRPPEEPVTLDRRANGTVIAKLTDPSSATATIYQLRLGNEVLAEERSYCRLIRVIMLGRL